MLELTHLKHSRMPDARRSSGAVLQLAPSKIDTERVVPVCPELSHVLARVVARAKEEDDHIQPVRTVHTRA
jgi:hypothetical protein